MNTTFMESLLDGDISIRQFVIAKGSLLEMKMGKDSVKCMFNYIRILVLIAVLVVSSA